MYRGGFAHSGRADPVVAGFERMFATLRGYVRIACGFMAALGLYGVLAVCGGAGGLAEIGIASRLGPDAGDVLWMMLRDSLLMVAIGVLLGIRRRLAVTQTASRGDLWIAQNDPLSFVAAGALMLAAATAAAWIPGTPCTLVDPMRLCGRSEVNRPARNHLFTQLTGDTPPFLV